MRTEKGREIWTLLSNAEKSWAIKANTIRILAQRYPKYWATAAQRLARDASQYLFEVKQIQYRLGDHVTLADVFSDLENGAFVEPVAINSIALTLTDEIPVVKPLQELLTTE
jgi:hypothetical protein